MFYRCSYNVDVYIMFTTQVVLSIGTECFIHSARQMKADDRNQSWKHYPLSGQRCVTVHCPSNLICLLQVDRTVQVEQFWRFTEIIRSGLLHTSQARRSANFCCTSTPSPGTTALIPIQTHGTRFNSIVILSFQTCRGNL